MKTTVTISNNGMTISNGKPEHLQRGVLPIPDKPYAGFVAYDARDPNSKFPPIEPLRPPPGAPVYAGFGRLSMGACRYFYYKFGAQRLPREVLLLTPRALPARHRGWSIVCSSGGTNREHGRPGGPRTESGRATRKAEE